MADFVQLPGVLNIRAIRGDELNVVISLQRNVTNYEFEAFFYSTDIVGGTGGTGSAVDIESVITSPTIGITNAATGSMIIGLTEDQTSLFEAGKGYRWYMRWFAPGDVTRTILSGSVLMESP